MTGELSGILITCEHGGNRIPLRYREHFDPEALRSHRGFDPGALHVARAMAHDLQAPLRFATVSRLLVDLNRSPHHHRLFSEYTRVLDSGAKQEILDRYYWPYRREVERSVRRLSGPDAHVLHLAIHSFTPVFEGRERKADLGILYDPGRRAEIEFARRLARALDSPTLKVRRNYPYRGSADGLTTALRRVFPDAAYAGIEIELNHGRFHDRTARTAIGQILVSSVREVLGLA